ncbi:MAG: hypothetical protein ACTHN7_10365, partial [Solirubrobacterales bacterium]
MTERRLFLFLVLGALICSAGSASAECTTSFVRAFGNPSGLQAPDDVAIDSSGDAWVADSGHKRIQEFGPTGAFITQFEVPETLYS